MKKDKHIVAKAALGTYLFVIGIGLVLNSWAEKTTIYNRELQESIMTAEDMIGWISEDVANGYIIDTVIADTYIDNLEVVITDLREVR